MWIYDAQACSTPDACAGPVSCNSWQSLADLLEAVPASPAISGPASSAASHPSLLPALQCVSNKQAQIKWAISCPCSTSEQEEQPPHCNAHNVRVNIAGLILAQVHMMLGNWS